MSGGLQEAARQVQSFGRGSDTMLAHISPDEAKMINYLQGGERTNPHTGLPEYGLLGNILKAVVRAGAAIGGFVLSGGNPLAAAAASSAATKLTGGSWTDAAKAGLITGATAGIGNLASSGGSALMSNAGLAAKSAGSALPQIAAPLVGSTAAAAAPAAAGGLFGGISAATSGIGGLTGVSTGLSAIGDTNNGGGGGPSGPVPTLPPQTPINLNVEPSNRQYQPYQGDYSHFAEPGGGMGHLFFNPVNDRPRLVQQPTQDQSQLEQQFLARGGRVRGYSLGGPSGPMGGRDITQPTMMQGPQMRGPGAPMGPGVPGAGVGQPNNQQAGILQAAMRGYEMAGSMGMARGGHVRGISAASMPSPAAMAGAISGPGDGKQDLIDAKLSDGEHVFDASVTADAGNGSNNAGHKVMENIKQEIRQQARSSSPKKPTKKINTSPHAVAAMVRRAKHKAGVTKVTPRMA